MPVIVTVAVQYVRLFVWECVCPVVLSGYIFFFLTRVSLVKGILISIRLPDLMKVMYKHSFDSTTLGYPVINTNGCSNRYDLRFYFSKFYP